MTDPIATLDAHRRLAEALMVPECYPWPVEQVERLETHISTVLLAGEYAIKLKKPLDLGFLDFSTLERRRHFCEEEIRLNARLAPQIYLRRVPVTGTQGAPCLDGEGETIEHAVLMRRFPEHALMSRLLREGRLPEEAVERLAETVAAFHAQLPAADPESGYGTVAAVAAPVQDNFRQLEQFGVAAPLRGKLRALERWSEEQLEALAPLIEQRLASGAVRECHGDLHLGNVAWHEGEPIVFDGIEFNPGLRWIDTANEVAFTIMDLDFEGARRLRYRFLDRYLERTGDYEALPLIPFYAVYRALVRAKINGLEAEQGAGSRSREALLEHVELAQGYTATPIPELVITYGLSGSGKSARARRLVEERGFIRLRSDVERKRLFGLDPRARSDSGVGEGLYTPEATQRTYARLIELSEQALGAGFSVVVDAAFLKAERRRPFLELARRIGCRFRILQVRAAEQTLRERLRQRRAEGHDPSEADEAVLDMQLQRAEPPSGEEAAFVETVDTDG
ncbi:MAG: AAA family ATPase [Halorhodospira sp.]